MVFNSANLPCAYNIIYKVPVVVFVYQVFLLSTCALLWLWSRNDLSRSLLPVVAAMLLLLCYRPLLLHILQTLLVLNPWAVLVVNGVLALAAGLVALQMYLGMTS